MMQRFSMYVEIQVVVCMKFKVMHWLISFSYVDLPTKYNKLLMIKNFNMH